MKIARMFHRMLICTPLMLININANAQKDSVPNGFHLIEPIVVEQDTTYDIPSFDELKQMDELVGIDRGITTMGTTSILSNTTYKVGTPSIESSVSPTGGATWSMMFDMPVGVGGFVPKMGLAYSSQSGSGNVGWGTNITGVSAITRGLKSSFYDDSVRGIKYDEQDALFLDGRRLLLSSGSEGQVGAVYNPEGEPFTNVTVTQSVTGLGPVSFEVTDNAGNTYLYGTTSNARLEVAKSSGVIHIHAWYMSRQEDWHGNYAEYTYMHDHYVLYPQTVTYGKNTHTGTGANNSIEFTYTGVYAGTLRTFVVDGVRGGIYKCLQEVQTKTGNALYRKYHMNYTYQDDSTLKYERLIRVTVSNSAGEEMKPVIVDWNLLSDATQTVSTPAFNFNQNPSWIEPQDSLLIAADFNGDGLADIARLSNVKEYQYNSGGNYHYYLYSYLFFNLAVKGENGSISYPYSSRVNIGSSFSLDSWTNCIAGNCIVDIDGDGLNDILIPWHEDAFFNSHGMYFKVILGSGIKSGNPTSYFDISTIYQSTTALPTVVTADFNLDGRHDIFYLETEKSNGYYTAALIIRKNGNSTSPVYLSFSLPKTPKRTFTGDFNSDGLSDIIVIHETGYKIFFNNASTVESNMFTDANSYQGSSITEKWRMEQGDFNGDGLIDFVYIAERDSKYYFALNNGDGTFNTTQAINYDIHDGASNYDNNRFNLHVLDLDHDGKSDLITGRAKSSSETETGWLVSNGTTLTEVKRVYTDNGNDEEPFNHAVADFDGDGYAEFMNYGYDLYTYTNAPNDGTKLRLYSSSGNGPGAGMVSSITDAMGSTHAFSYATTSDTLAYVHEFDGSYPRNDVHEPLTVVKSLSVNQGAAGGLHTLSYRYSGMKMHATGKGMLGFHKLTNQDDKTGITSTSETVQWNDTYHVPTKTRAASTMGTVTEYKVTNMILIPKGSKNYYLAPTTEISTDMDGNITTTTYSFNYTYGYLTKQHTEYGNSGNMYKETGYGNYSKIAERYLPGIVNTKQKHADQAEVFQSVTLLTYDAVGNVTQTVERSGTTMALTTQCAYDDYGNLTSTRTSGGVTDITTYTTYDATGRFPTNKYQVPAAAVNQYTYDTWGNMLTETDATEATNPLTATYVYDSWGDCTQVTKPTGVVETYTTEWASPTTYTVTHATQGQGSVKTWHDAYGRLTREDRKAVMNVDLIKLIGYNAWGGQYVGTTYIGADRICANATYFDQRGRLASVIHQLIGVGGNYSSYGTYYSYGNRSVTVTEDGRSCTTTTDAWGNVISASDPGGTVSYTYYSNGLPASTEADGAVVTMEYDVAGNRTLISDPDAGDVSSTYSADGLLLNQTDARGVTTTNTYDALGRLSTSTCDTLTTTYTYGTSGSSALRLVERNLGDMRETFSYDAYGRLTSHAYYLGMEASAGHSYLYNSDGLLSSHIYPTGLAITYTYDVNGHRTGLAANGSPIWSVKSYDGYTLEEYFGNAVIASTEDKWGSLVERTARHKDSLNIAHRFTFGYSHPRNNLTSRMGVGGAGLTETFTYDSTDRLTGAYSGESITGTFTYASNGNILSKTGLGDYSYDSSRPHAVTGVENDGGAIVSVAQTIDYHPFGKASLIQEGTCRHIISYGPDGQRWKVEDYEGTLCRRLTYYQGDYETHVIDGHLYRFHYLDEGIIVLKQDSADYWYFYGLKDNVGSYMKVITGEATTAFEAYYDPWGKQVVIKNDINLKRGFGGHEMLPQYRLINMNGRMYDSTLGRFLSPDTYVQEPTNSQNFNRYSYCLNNPLKYSDPSGELFGVDDLIVAAASFAVSYITNSISTNNWGWSSISKSLISAGMSLAGFHMGEKISAWKYAGLVTANGVLNSVLPPMTIYVGNHFTFNAFPSLTFGTDGLNFGIFSSIGYHNDDLSFSIGGSLSTRYTGWMVSASYAGIGVSYSKTYYPSEAYGENKLGKQSVGTYSVNFAGECSFSISNDLWGDGQDRWRTTAAELTIKDISVGTYVYTNWGLKESGYEYPDKLGLEKSSKALINDVEICGIGKNSQWNNGHAYFAPLWIGLKHNGVTYRFGHSNKHIHNATQNFIHQKFKKGPYFKHDEPYFKTGFYSMQGRTNPLSLFY